MRTAAERGDSGLPHKQTNTATGRCPIGSELITSPIPTHKGGGCRDCGPTRWPEVAVREDPGAITL
eukprot:7974289-Pyramimonas_sp.AAC.2